MAAEEKVIIRVEIDSDITNDLLGIERRLKRLEGRQKSFNRTSGQTDDRLKKVATNSRNVAKNLNEADDKMKKLDRNTNRVNRRFSALSSVFRKVSSVLRSFIMTLGKISFIALAGQVGLFTAALVGVKVALLAGRGAVSLYNTALKGLSVTAAAVISGLSVAAAAIRQFSEVQLAANFGGGVAGRTTAARLSRGVSSQVRGLLGTEATAGIVGALARGGVRGNQNALIRQLFNITGGDGAAAQSIAQALAGKDVAQARKAVEGAAGFQEGSLKGQNLDSMAALRQFVAGGGATAEGFSSLGDDMARTFIGTFKTEFAGIVGLFADLGEPLLGPFRDAFVEISRIVKNDLMGMMQVVQRFGADSFAPTLVTIIDKTSEFIRSNVVNNLQDVEQMGKNFVGFFRSVGEFFSNVGSALRAMEPAADVVIDMFRAMGGAAGGRGLFRAFRDLVVENAEAFENFGAGIGNVIGSVFDLLKGGQSGFFNSLDRISEVLNTVASELVPAIGKILDAITPVLEKLPDLVSTIADGLEMVAGPIEVLANAVAMLVQVLAGMGGIGGLLALGGFGAFKSFQGDARRYGGFGRAFEARRRRFQRAGGVGGIPGRIAAQGGRGLGGVTSGMGMIGLGLGVAGVGSAYNDGGGASSMLSSAAGGAMLGFSIGGPLGAAAGAIVGGIAGVLAGAAGRERIRKATLAAIDTHSADIRKVTEDIRGTAVTSVAQRDELQALATADRAQLELFDTALAKKAEMTTIRTLTADQAVAPSGIDREQGEALANTLITQQLDENTRELLDRHGAQYVDPAERTLSAAIEGARRINFSESEFSKTVEYNDVVASLRAQGFGEMLDNMDVGEILTAIGPDGKITQAIEERIRETDIAIMETTRGLEFLSEALNATEADISRVAEALGVDLRTAVDNLGAQLMIQAGLVGEMDRNRTFLPDLSTSALGVQEKNATANAMFEAIAGAGAGDLTTGMVADAIEAFAAYEIALGNSPDLAAISGIFEIEEKMAQLTGGDPEKERILRGQVESAYTSTFGQMDKEYGLESGRARAVYDRAGGGQAGLEALDTSLQQRQTYINALIGGGGMGLSDRLSTLQGATDDNLYRSSTLERAFLQNLTATGLADKDVIDFQRLENPEERAEVLQGLLERAANGELAGFDQQQFMTDFITMEAPGDAKRDGLLGEIVNAVNLTTDAVNNIDINVGADPERAPRVTGLLKGSIGRKLGAGSLP